MIRLFEKLTLALLLAWAFGTAAPSVVYADSCSVPSDCVFLGWYEDLQACKTNSYNSGYGFWTTGNSTNCSDGNACVACFGCTSAEKKQAP
jgi:hypothetical protein